MHACMHAYIHTYIQACIHTYMICMHAYYTCNSVYIWRSSPDFLVMPSETCQDILDGASCSSRCEGTCVSATCVCDPTHSGPDCNLLNAQLDDSTYRAELTANGWSYYTWNSNSILSWVLQIGSVMGETQAADILVAWNRHPSLHDHDFALLNREIRKASFSCAVHLLREGPVSLSSVIGEQKFFYWSGRLHCVFTDRLFAANFNHRLAGVHQQQHADGGGCCVAVGGRRVGHGRPRPHDK